MAISQKAIFDVVLAAACRGRMDEMVRRTARGQALVAVSGRRTGLASRLQRNDVPAGAAAATELTAMPGSLKETACLLLSAGPDPEPRSFGLAAVNALLPPPDTAEAGKAQDLLLEAGRGKRVAVVGHFPFLERLEHGFANLTILELAPRPGDTPASRAPEVVPQADVLAITGQAIANGTLAELLHLARPGAFVLLLGPSTPFAPGLFDLGVSALCGAVVTDADRALAGVLEGKSFRELGGVESRVWRK